MVGLIDRGLYDRAWAVFDDMRINHCEPDEVVFTSMINGALSLLCPGSGAVGNVRVRFIIIKGGEWVGWSLGVCRVTHW